MLLGEVKVVFTLQYLGGRLGGRSRLFAKMGKRSDWSMLQNWFELPIVLVNFKFQILYWAIVKVCFKVQFFNRLILFFGLSPDCCIDRFYRKIWRSDFLIKSLLSAKFNFQVCISRSCIKWSNLSMVQCLYLVFCHYFFILLKQV